jgi:hypothetical protein
MKQRAIVRDADDASSRWRFEGTNILVSDIKRDYLAGQANMRGTPYEALGLTRAEIDSALSFEFPPLNDVAFRVDVVGFDIHCVCGERRQTMAAPPSFETDQCVCGRTWRITVGIEAGSGVPGSPSPNGQTR